MILKTKILKDKKDFIQLRIKNIQKALAFSHGESVDNPCLHKIKQITGDSWAVFYKPGKETQRKNPNSNDMRPAILKNGEDITPKWAFQDMWEYLLKISIIQQEAFKKVLVLLYRLCYMLDYQDGVYAPNATILQEIQNIQTYILKPGFVEKFGGEEIALLDFLYFVDLLAWNEDVKYQADELFSKNKNKGRVNTVLSILSAPLLISKFIQNIRVNSDTGKIDVNLITTTIQKFAKTRGLCVLSQKELLANLSPYLE